jgi:hypothetical protein
MANQIMTQEFAETIAATIKKEIPILEYVNKELSDRLETGSGATVSVLVPNFGKVSKGASFLDGSAGNNVQTLGSITDLQVQVDKVPVTVDIRKIGASYDVLEKTLKLYTDKNQINEPRISNLARTINADVFKCVFSAAHSAIVGQIGFIELAEAVAYVDESRVGDETAGMLSPLLNNSVAASGANKFANPKLGLELYNGTLGSWMDAEFFKSADAGSIKLGSVVATAFAISGNVANVNDGDEQLTLSGLTFGGSTLTSIPAGTPFVIGTGDPATAGSVSSPFTVSSVYGDDTQIIRTFVALVNPNTVDGSWPINAGSSTVGVAPIYLNQNVAQVVTPSTASVPNTWYTGDVAQAALTFICPLLAGTKYALGAVFADKAIAFASASPRPLGGGADSTSTTLDGEVNARTTITPDGREGADLWRVDVLYGMSALYGAGAVALYGQII